MAAADAYDCLPNIIEAERGTGLKLLTTGLIDPCTSLWGIRNCRYLKRNFRHPRLEKGSTRSLYKRMERASRPKIIVAGLSKRIECLVDPDGEYIGAVSTYSIYHSKDDVKELRRLCDLLLEPETTNRFRAELGANAMGGGSITMKRSFLENLPLGWERL